MSEQHTPGPWEVEESCCYLVFAKDGGLVATMESMYDGPLIAAAPRILAALKSVVRIADRDSAEFNEARAAIAEAEREA